MVQYQKYFEVCDAFVKMVNLLLAKKILIFKVNQIYFFTFFTIIIYYDMYNYMNILETQFHHLDP